MANINLLPWREERRVKAKRQFFSILFGTAIIGAGVVYVADINVKSQIDHQVARNSYVEQETKALDKEIAEIDELKKQRERLIERMEVIQNLQGNRAVIVHHFDEFVRSIPEGVYFTRLEKKGSKFHIEGVADANNRVSNLMLNLDRSDWFKESNLMRVTNQEGDEESSSSSFVLGVLEEMPKSHGKEEG